MSLVSYRFSTAQIHSTTGRQAESSAVAQSSDGGHCDSTQDARREGEHLGLGPSELAPVTLLLPPSVDVGEPASTLLQMAHLSGEH